MASSFSASVLPDIPLIEPGTDLVRLILASAERNGPLRDGDVLVIAQKIVSKSEGRYVDLATVQPGTAAIELASQVDKDPRFVEVVLQQSRRVLRHRPGLLIVEHHLGLVMANAGIDQSNVDPAAGKQPVLLLPEDPDASADKIRLGLWQQCGKRVAVIINDSFGRAWRRGTVGVALGAAGLPALIDLRGNPDLFGRPLQVSETAFADEVAAAASVLMGQADESAPIVLVRGLRWRMPPNPAATLIRDAKDDLFR